MKFQSYEYSLPYIFFFLYLVFLLIVELHYIKQGKKNKIIQKMACLGFIFFFGLRGYIVGDVFVYSDWFNSLPTLFSDAFFIYWKSFKLNFGFSFLMILIKTIWNNYLFFQFICTIIQVVLLDIAIQRYSKKYYVLTCILFYTFGGTFLSLNLIRNYISILIFILSLKYIETCKFSKYLFLNLLGFTIHFSSILFIPFYFILKAEIKKIWFWSVFIIGIILYVTQIKYLYLICDFLGSLLPPIFGNIVRGYAIAGRSLIVEFTISMGFFERGLSFVLMMFFYNSYSRNNITSRIFMNILLVYIISFYYFGEFADIMGRFMTLFVCYYWFLFPKFFGKLKQDGKLVFLLIAIIIGISKTISQTDSILFKYENIIFGIQKIESRRHMYNSVMQKL
jgi:hypothetical protein